MGNQQSQFADELASRKKEIAAICEDHLLFIFDTESFLDEDIEVLNKQFNDVVSAFCSHLDSKSLSPYATSLLHREIDVYANAHRYTVRRFVELHQTAKENFEVFASVFTSPTYGDNGEYDPSENDVFDAIKEYCNKEAVPQYARDIDLPNILPNTLIRWREGIFRRFLYKSAKNVVSEAISRLIFNRKERIFIKIESALTEFMAQRSLSESERVRQEQEQGINADFRDAILSLKSLPLSDRAKIDIACGEIAFNAQSALRRLRSMRREYLHPALVQAQGQAHSQEEAFHLLLQQGASREETPAGPLQLTLQLPSEEEEDDSGGGDGDKQEQEQEDYDEAIKHANAMFSGTMDKKMTTGSLNSGKKGRQSITPAPLPSAEEQIANANSMFANANAKGAGATPSRKSIKFDPASTGGDKDPSSSLRTRSRPPPRPSTPRFSPSTSTSTSPSAAAFTTSDAHGTFQQGDEQEQQEDEDEEEEDERDESRGTSFEQAVEHMVAQHFEKCLENLRRRGAQGQAGGGEHAHSQTQTQPSALDEAEEVAAAALTAIVPWEQWRESHVSPLLDAQASSGPRSRSGSLSGSGSGLGSGSGSPRNHLPQAALSAAVVHAWSPRWGLASGPSSSSSPRQLEQADQADQADLAARWPVDPSPAALASVKQVENGVSTSDKKTIEAEVEAQVQTKVDSESEEVKKEEEVVDTAGTSIVAGSKRSKAVKGRGKAATPAKRARKDPTPSADTEAEPGADGTGAGVSSEPQEVEIKAVGGGQSHVVKVPTLIPPTPAPLPTAAAPATATAAGLSGPISGLSVSTRRRSSMGASLSLPLSRFDTTAPVAAPAPAPALASTSTVRKGKRKAAVAASLSVGEDAEGAGEAPPAKPSTRPTPAPPSAPSAPSGGKNRRQSLPSASVSSSSSASSSSSSGDARSGSSRRDSLSGTAQAAVTVTKATRAGRAKAKKL